MNDELIVFYAGAEEHGLTDAVSDALSGIGINGGTQTVSGLNELLECLSKAVKRSNLVITLVGPEEYIRSKRIVAKSLGLEFSENKSVRNKMGKLAEDKKYQYHDYFPEGAVVLDSPDNLYSGYYLKSGSRCIVFAPLDSERAPYILQKTGINVSLAAGAKNVARFIGVSKAALNDYVKDFKDISFFEITEDMYDTVLKFETNGATDEKARKNGEKILDDLKSCYGNAMYGRDERSLVNRVIGELLSQNKTLAIADSENAMHIVSYLAGEKHSSEVCKVIRLTSAKTSISEREDVSAFVGRVHEKSGFDYAVGIGDLNRDEESGKCFVYCAYANQKGVLTKRILKKDSEEDAAFKIRCVRELVLLFYNDIMGELSYAGGKVQTAGRSNSAKKEEKPEPPQNENAVITDDGNDGSKEEAKPQRNTAVSPKIDKKTTRNLALLMIVAALVILIVAILICREPASNSDNEITTTSSLVTLEEKAENIESTTDFVTEQTGTGSLRNSSKTALLYAQIFINYEYSADYIHY